MKDYQGASISGEFYLSSKTYSGQLKIDRENSTLNLHSKESFHFKNVKNTSIKGLLSDNNKVSLIDCTTLANGSTSGPGGSQYHLSIFPHYIIFGDQHIEPTDAKILALDFIIKDASTLFYDFDAFGVVLKEDCDSKKFLQRISNKREEIFEVGEDPWLIYYSGKKNVFISETSIGKVSASHCPSTPLPSPDGVQLKNSIPISIEFPTLLSFEEVLKRFKILMNFVDMILGTPQPIEDLSVKVESEEGIPKNLKVYSSMHPDYKTFFKPNNPQPMDVLINGGINPHEFSEVLSSWILRQENWEASRFRFIQSFRQKNQYSIDRLIASANMFDILPEDAFGRAESIEEEVALAIDQCKSIFRKIKSCSERDSILGALGRISTHNLKSKVKNRARLITDKIGDNLPELEFVIDHSINCRNYYVHGTQGKMTPQTYNSFYMFFTDTLEFIFGASDLIESEWDIKKWVSQKTCLSHPFALYLHGYPSLLRKFKSSID